MELFTKSKAVKLRAHNGKYLAADEDRQTIRQTRNRASNKTIWMVEHNSKSIRLRNCHGQFLSASDLPFLLGVTGNKVVQVPKERSKEEMAQWEPVREGFQVKLRSWCGTFLRANGGTPPWRNSVTHDEPHVSATGKWILWDIEDVDLEGLEFDGRLSFNHLESLSSFASDHEFGSEPGTPVSAVSHMSSTKQIHISSGKFPSAMETFRNAKAVRLKSHHHKKYLFADDDEESVTQDRNGSSNNARWTVEFVSVSDSLSVIRLKSCHGKYLTASNQPFLLGMTGRKVLQTRPPRLDSSVEWEPVREGSLVRLKTRYGNFLRGNGGLPPWRNSVTHDVPNRTASQDLILWDVDVVEIEIQSSVHETLALSEPDSPMEVNSSSSSSVSFQSAHHSIAESNDSGGLNSPSKSEGRKVFYQIAADDDEEEDSERRCLNFNGKGVGELTRKLEQVIGIEGVIVCNRSPLNGKLYPIRLQLPPNNAAFNVVLVLKSSKLGIEFEKQGLI